MKSPHSPTPTHQDIPTRSRAPAVVACGAALTRQVTVVTNTRGVFFASAMLSSLTASLVQGPLLKMIPPVGGGIPIRLDSAWEPVILEFWGGPMLHVPVSWVPVFVVVLFLQWPLFWRRSLPMTALAGLLVYSPALFYLAHGGRLWDMASILLSGFLTLFWISIFAVYRLRAVTPRETWLSGALLGLVPHGIFVAALVAAGFLGGYGLFIFVALYFFAWIAPLISLALLWRRYRAWGMSPASA